MCQEWAMNGWRTIANSERGAHLAQVPKEPQPISAQLEAALKKKGVSQAELSRRLAATDETDSEAKRRWLQKILANPEVIPEPESLAEIEVALGLRAGYFKRPTRAAVRARRGELEEEVAGLKHQLALSRRAQAGLLRRVVALEKALSAPPQSARSARAKPQSPS